MNSANSAATHVGRVGALALALGIGVAVASGSGVAWADNGTRGAGTGSSGTGSSEQAGSDTDSSPAAPSRRGPRGPAPVGEAAPAAIPNDLPAVALRPVVEQVVPVREPVKNDNPRTVLPAAASVPAPVAAPTGPRVSVSVPAAASAPVSAAAVVSPSAIVVQPAAAAPVVTQLVAVPAVSAPTITPAAAATLPVLAPRQVATPVAAFASRLLSAVGLAQLAGTGVPGAPLDSPALWALLGWARREPLRIRSAATTAALPTAAVVATAPPTTLPSTPIGWVTGQSNTAYPGAGWRQTNNTRWANVYGTDLGIMWFNGVNGKTQVAFGDTFSGPNMTGDWRSNVLLLSDDTNLSDGLSLLNTGPAYQFIPAAPGQVFFIGSEVTNIPTSAVYANNNNYVNYMSVKSWDTPGRWTTNYSAISQYDPKTDKWVLQKQTVRPAGYFRSSTMYQAGDQNFQQMAYVVEPESKVAPGQARYVYAFGTPAGRAGSAYLSRVPENAVTDLKQYQYWDGKSWVSNQANAAPIIGDSTRSTGLFGWAIDLANDPNVLGGSLAGFTGAKTGGNVSEMSVQYNEYLGKYVVLYGNGANNVILRTADDPAGPWSDPVTIATSLQYPGLYAPMIHPLSGTGQLTDSNGKPDDGNLYWNMSLWGNYNVVLMKTDVSALKVTTV
jgi:hypothetical protein